MKGRIVSVNGRYRSESSYSEVGDSAVDHLLLRYLCSCVSHARCNKIVFAHLIMGRSITKPFSQPPLNHPSSLRTEPPCLLSVIPAIFQRVAKTFDKGEGGEQPASVLGQLFVSPRLLRVSVGGCRGGVLFEPVQLGFEIPDLLL